MSQPRAFLSLDVEDWEHANFAELTSRRSEIDAQVLKVRYPMDRAVYRWIEILEQYSVRSTCFVLGDFARRFPDAVRALHHAGHEIASHGDRHDLVREMTPELFREFLKRSIDELTALTGAPVKGFRAPSWSIPRMPQAKWVYEILAEFGIAYDSSVFPVSTPLFGDPSAPLAPDSISGVVRIPVGLLPGRLPFSTGAFFRLTPTFVQLWGLRHCANLGHVPQVVLHPREFMADHPRLPLLGWKRWVHYAALDRVEPRLHALLPRFSWGLLSEFAQN